MTTTHATRRRRHSLVVLAGDGDVSDRGARALAQALTEAGVVISYLGREQCPSRIAQSVADAGADAVEVCFASRGGVLLLRGLLRELASRGRRDVSIVIHRVQ